MKKERRFPLDFLPGVTTEPDATKRDTVTAIAMGNGRFYRGRFQSAGGTNAITYGSSAVVLGSPRWLRNHFVSSGSLRYTLIGTNQKLYALLGNTLTNITPLVETSAGTTLGSNPLTTINGTTTITVAHTAHGFVTGDRIRFSGATSSWGGVTATDFNSKQFIVTVTGVDAYTVTIATTASSVASGGGAAVKVQGEIADGQADANAGYGAGMGLAGAGLAGTGRSGTNQRDPRMYSGDRFGNNLVLTAGDGTRVYQWTGTTATAPAYLTNAPTTVDYVFVTNDIIVTLYGNLVSWSDQGGSTTWTPAATNQAGSDTIEGAGSFLSHCKAGSVNLLFTGTQVWRFRYIGTPAIFETIKIKEGDGIIARNARVEVNGAAYFQGKSNFYRYAGGQVEVIPGCTIHDVVFKNLHPTQLAKCFAEYRESYGEIRFHYVSADSPDGEPDRVAVYCLADGHWEEYEEARLAASQGDSYDYPLLINDSGTLYQHEYGETTEEWFVETHPFAPAGTRNLAYLQGIYPDGDQDGDVSVVFYSSMESQGDESTSDTYTVGASDDFVPVRITGKFNRVRISGTGRYRMGRNEIGWLPGPAS